MGLLVDGVWQEERPELRTGAGRFMRQPTRFHHWVTEDGSAGPTGEAGFPAARGRYHLYVALACPWAHRTVIFRALKGLEDVVSMSVVEPIYGPHGWRFGSGPGTIPDHVNGASELADIYLLAEERYSGRVSVPVLWDKNRRTIVNNGVYRAGFATTQEAYEEAFRGLFSVLDEIEERLARQRYLAGSIITEADWRLFTTLVRFDAVYYSHFKCNLRRIIDYPNLSNYLRDLYQQPGIAATVNMDHIKRHYYGSQLHVNPRGIVPLGPKLDFTAPHDRGRFGS